MAILAPILQKSVPFALIYVRFSSKITHKIGDFLLILNQIYKFPADYDALIWQKLMHDLSFGILETPEITWI